MSGCIDGAGTGPEGTNDYIAAPGGNNTIFGERGHDVIVAGEGNDTLYAGNGDSGPGDQLSGRGGDDVLVGGLLRDKIADGAGNDLIAAGGGDDWISLRNYPPSENDDWQIIHQYGVGEDSYYMGSGADVVREDYTLSDGDDSILTGFGTDLAWGGPGNDTIVASPEPTTQLTTGRLDELYGGPGNDYLRHYTPFESYGWLTHVVAPKIVGGPGSDYIYTLDFSTDRVWPGEDGSNGPLTYGPCEVDWSVPPADNESIGTVTCGLPYVGEPFQVEYSSGVLDPSTPNAGSDIDSIQGSLLAIEVADGGLEGGNGDVCVCDPTVKVPLGGNGALITVYTDQNVN